MSETYFFYVNGMTCAGCSGNLENSLKNKLTNRLVTFHADVTQEDPKKTTIVLHEKAEDHQKTWNELRNYIIAAGFSCEEYEYPIEEQDEDEIPVEEIPQAAKQSFFQKLKAKGKKFFTSHWFLGALGCTTGVAVLIFCLISPLSLPVMLPLASISVLLTFILGANSYYDAWSKLTKTRTLTMDSLFALSTAAILIVSVASLFVPWLPMMFDAALLIYGFRHIGIAIEESLKEKISSTKFLDRAPKTVRLQTIDGSKSISLKKIKINDIIIINPGELIPLDGVCLDERSIYNTIISGSPLPRLLQINNVVLAGMRLAHDAKPLTIRVSKNAHESYLARLDAHIEQSILEKAPIELKTGTILNYFIPAVLGLAVLAGIVIGFYFTPALAIQTAVSVLVSACPCTLGLITPLAVKTGIHKAAEHGVQFKSAKSLQLAEQIDTVIFDLNGTLTTGIPKVTQFTTAIQSNQLSNSELLAICAALEEESNHPIGKAIFSYAKEKEPEKLEVTELEKSHHSGVSGQINGKKYTLGSLTLMHEQGIVLPDNMTLPVLDSGDHLIFLAQEHRVIGFIKITDPLRDDAYRTINSLTAMGKQVHLCTGADKETAARYAKALGIKEVVAECIATSKTDHIQSLRKKGQKVAMIGDAGNDAPAMAACDFGIAIASLGGDELTQQKADAVIHNGCLLPIASAFAISKQAVSNIKQNLGMSLGYNLAALFISSGFSLAIGFMMNPAIGVTLMILQACFILLNVYRFKKQPLEHLQETSHSAQEASYKEIESSSHQKISQYVPITQPQPTFEVSTPDVVFKGARDAFWEDRKQPQSTTPHSTLQLISDIGM